MVYHSRNGIFKTFPQLELKKKKKIMIEIIEDVVG